MQTILYFHSAVKQSDSGKVDGARDLASRQGWHFQTVTLTPTVAQFRALREFWKPIGAIVDCDGWKTPVKMSTFAGFPTVFIDSSEAEIPSGTVAISLDSRAIGRDAARELLGIGYDSFAYVPFPGNPNWSRERGEEFLGAIALNGKACKTFSDRSVSHDNPGYRSRLAQFLSGLPRPTAIFAANDEIAEAISVTCGQGGFSIPEDFAVLGADNYEKICEQATPPLSSIALDFRRGGELAALMLARILDGRVTGRGNRTRTFGTARVVRRASTRTISDAEVAAACERIRREAFNGLTVNDVLKDFSCSQPIATARFRRIMGHSILDEIHSVQLERAKMLIDDGDRQLKSIANFCGFTNPNSLRKFFLRETGVTMSAWRKRRRNG
jgi:LacI family transcriptional regulator